MIKTKLIGGDCEALSAALEGYSVEELEEMAIDKINMQGNRIKIQPYSTNLLPA